MEWDRSTHFKSCRLGSFSFFFCLSRKAITWWKSINKKKGSEGYGGGEEGGLTASSVVGDAEDGDAVCALDVEDVAVLGVGDVRVLVTGDALQDLSRYGARVRGCPAELHQHYRPPRHQSVEDRHPAPSLPLICLSKCIISYIEISQ